MFMDCGKIGGEEVELCRPCYFNILPCLTVQKSSIRSGYNFCVLTHRKTEIGSLHVKTPSG